ncbi:MAG: hypothetical protein ACI87E_002279 [Mariniblastus sp.]|jgi:hypothetical protein
MESIWNILEIGNENTELAPDWALLDWDKNSYTGGL